MKATKKPVPKRLVVQETKAKTLKKQPKPVESKKKLVKAAQAFKLEKTGSKKSAKKSGIVFEEGSTKLESAKVSEAIKALLKLVDSKKSTALLEEGGEKIVLQVTGIKVPKESRKQLVQIVLPHCPLPDPYEVCLFVKDLQKGLKVDHEPTLQHFQTLLKEHGVTNVAQVISLRELKVEYKQFESKTKLSHRFDRFLADERILRLLPQFLGKAFYKRKRFPVAVDLTASDLKAELDTKLKTVTLPLSNAGTCAQVEVANTKMDAAEIVGNILAVGDVLAKRYPGGWKNIRSIHVKSENALAIPLHISTASTSDVGFIDADLPADKNVGKSETDELSTQPGVTVTVTRRGIVKVSKKSDPNWDDTKGEPLVEESDEEEEEKEEESNDDEDDE